MGDLIGAAIFDDVMTGALFLMGGIGLNVAWGLILGIAGAVVGDLLGTTSPTSVANNVNTLFANQESYWGYFQVAYELDDYLLLATPAYSIYGAINGGSVNLFGSVGLPGDSTDINNYISAFGDYANAFGENTWTYFSNPPHGRRSSDTHCDHMWITKKLLQY